MNQFPPRVASELHDRLLEIDPRLREISNMAQTGFTGDQLFTLLGAVWLSGYGTACGDLAPLVPDAVDLPERAEMILEEFAR